MSEGIDYILEQVIPDIMGPLPVGGQQFSKAVGFTGNTIQKDLYGNISRLPKVQNFRDNSLSLVNNTQRFFDVGKFYRDSKNLIISLRRLRQLIIIFLPEILVRMHKIYQKIIIIW